MSIGNIATNAIAAVEAIGATGPVSTTGPAAATDSSSFNRFNAAYENAASQSSLNSGSALGRLMDPLLSLNEHSTKLAEAADVSGAADLRPGELLNLTMRSHEFLFHCQLVSNVANRSSDGLQQLFRQQS